MVTFFAVSGPFQSILQGARQTLRVSRKEHLPDVFSITLSLDIDIL